MILTPPTSQEYVAPMSPSAFEREAGHGDARKPLQTLRVRGVTGFAVQDGLTLAGLLQ